MSRTQSNFGPRFLPLLLLLVPCLSVDSATSTTSALAATSQTQNTTTTPVPIPTTTAAVLQTTSDQTAESMKLPGTYECQKTHTINLVLPFPIPPDGQLVVILDVNSTFSDYSISPQVAMLGPNMTEMSFRLHIGLSTGILSLNFQLSGPSKANYIFPQTYHRATVVCPQLDPKTAKWWEINSPWVVPVLITISCMIFLLFIFWRRRQIANAAILSVRMMQKAVASVAALSASRIENVEIGDGSFRGQMVSMKVGVFDEKDQEGDLKNINFPVNSLDVWEKTDFRTQGSGNTDEESAAGTGPLNTSSSGSPALTGPPQPLPSVVHGNIFLPKTRAPAPPLAPASLEPSAPPFPK